MTRVLHILDHSVPVTDGYSIRSRNIVQSQRACGIDAVVLTSQQHEPAVQGNPEEHQEIRYHRTRKYSESRIPFWRESQRVRCMVNRIDEVIRLEQPDILHAHSPCLWGRAATKVARRRGLPVLYEIRGFWEDAAVDLGKTTETSVRYKVSQWLETSVCRKVDAVTTIAKHLKCDLVERGVAQEKIHLTPNGVDANEFQPLQTDKDLKNSLGGRDRVFVGYIGSLFAWEGVDDLIEAIPLIVQSDPRVVVVIVGGGQFEQRIRNLIAKTDVGNHVRFIGRVSHDEVAKYYSILDVLIYPRKRTRNTELCTPLKPLEAMAMEKAILVSDVGGITELLGPETGIQFRSGDVADLATKCVTLTSDTSLRSELGRNARKHVIATRGWQQIAKSYMAVYERLSAAKTSRQTSS